MSVAVVLTSVLVLESSLVAVSPQSAAYYGGTINIFGNPKKPVEGTISTQDNEALVFRADKEFNSLTFSIPYASIIDLEYGQSGSTSWSHHRLYGVAGTARPC